MLWRASFLKLVKEQIDTFLHLQHHCRRLPSHVHRGITTKLQDGIKISVITSRQDSQVPYVKLFPWI